MGMSSTTTDETLRDQMAAAAVGALPRHERDELTRALGRRPALQHELDDLEDVAAGLAAGVTADPPAWLWDRIARRLSTPRCSRPMGR